MRQLFVVALSLFLLFPIFPVSAQDKGEMAFIMQSALSGQRDAQYVLALKYFDGDGVPKSLKDAERFWLASAQQGLKESQYSIGVFYSGHGEAPSSVINKRLSYVWLRMAALQGMSAAEDVRKLVAADMDAAEIGEAEKLSALYYDKYVVPFMEQIFTVELNGTSYKKSGSVTPTFPIMAVFRHSNPAVVAVRMQHPGNPDMSMTFDVGKQYRIQNHEDHMRAGHVSSSEFIALDKDGNERGVIALSFVP